MVSILDGVVLDGKCMRATWSDNATLHGANTLHNMDRKRMYLKGVSLFEHACLR